ncbi:DUF3108 domain-containing protein [Flavobacteriaceae bacterium Ap0902]|nr:DUF3108 domain-containing protein [Flavobacteriaceae bacterium Ap0902]
MKNLLYLLSFFLFVHIGYGQGYMDNELLKYRVHYGFLNAGFATLKLEETTYNGKAHYHVTGSGSSSGAVRIFYKVDNNYETYFEKDGLRPSKFIRQITESNYSKNKILTFDHEKKVVVINDLKNKRVKYERFDVPVQDMLSAFYYLRTKSPDEFRTGEYLNVNVFMDDEVYPFRLKVDGREKIKTKFGWINAIKLTPYVQKGRVFKESESVTMWVSDDENLIPLSVHAELVVGKLKMDLEEYKNNKYPLEFN